SFLDFVEKLAQSGYVHLKTSGRSVMVELNESFVEEPRAAAEGEEAAAPSAPLHAEPGSQPSTAQPSVSAAPTHQSNQPQHPEPVGPPLGDHADGVQKAGRILGAATGARWPMYLRNVKQILRQTEGGFDERRYGFGGLMDLLKACQREGFVRVERDRR